MPGQAGPLSGQLLASLGWQPGWLVGQRLAGRVGAFAGCTPGPGLLPRTALHRVADKSKHMFRLLGQVLSVGIFNKWQSTLSINKQDNENRNTTAR